MKARVLKNGRIVNIYPKEAADCAGRLKYIEKGKGLSYYEDELDFIDYSEQPDYWEKLKHQYAGMILAATYSSTLFENTSKVDLYKNAILMARELVNKLKEEEK